MSQRPGSPMDSPLDRSRPLPARGTPAARKLRKGVVNAARANPAAARKAIRANPGDAAAFAKRFPKAAARVQQALKQQVTKGSVTDGVPQGGRLRGGPVKPPPFKTGPGPSNATRSGPFVPPTDPRGGGRANPRGPIQGPGRKAGPLSQTQKNPRREGGTLRRVPTPTGSLRGRVMKPVRGRAPGVPRPIKQRPITRPAQPNT